MDEKNKDMKRKLLSFAAFIFISIAILLLIVYVSRCLGFLVCAVFVTSLYLHSWVSDREFKARFVEPSVKVLNIFLHIFFFVMLWLCVLAFCTIMR